MDSREARIAFVVGALAGAGVAVLWTSGKQAGEILERLHRTGELIEARARSLDQLLGEVTAVAHKTTRRFDAMSDAVEANLTSSIVELGHFFRDLKSELDHLLPDRVA